jgi:hypothetical protein
VLAQRQGVRLELRRTTEGALSFELTPPPLDVEEARTATLGAERNEGPNDIS